MSKSFTMYQLMDRAENKPFGSGEIKAYDEAIYQTRAALGMDESATYDEIVDESTAKNILYDERGNIITDV